MDCPHCSSQNIRQLDKKTHLGYQKFYCRSGCKQLNERTGTKLNFLEYMTEIVMLVVYYYYRFKVSLDDVVELMSLRGFL
jgi:putative transposase